MGNNFKNKQKVTTFRLSLKLGNIHRNEVIQMLTTW